MRTAWTGMLVLVAVAVAAMAMAAIWGSGSRSASIESELGGADVIYSGTAPADTASNVSEALLAQLPSGSRVEVEQTIPGLVLIPRGADGTADPVGVGGAYVDVRMADWADPLLQGVLGFVDGRVPREGEVVVSPDLAESLQLEVGDRVAVDSSSGSLVVAGVATIGNDGAATAAVATGELVPAASTEPAEEVALTAFVGLPVGAVAPSGAAMTDQQLEALGLSGPLGRPGDPAAAEGSALVASENHRVEAVALTVMVLSVVFVGLLAGASSGIGARRRLRASGLLAANGADGRQLAVAAAAEVIVVAVPAALLGLVACWAGLNLWVRSRLQGWPVAVDAALSWVWVVPLVAGAVVAAGLGAVYFSRVSRSLPTSVLLDSRTRPTLRAGGRLSVGWAGWIVVAVLGWVAMSYVTVGGGWIGPAAALVLLLLWVASGSVALRLAGPVLRRDPVGRVVERDLRHRRLGSAATVLVVATWVFVAVLGTATAALGSTYQNDEGPSVAVPTTAASESTSSAVGPTVDEPAVPEAGTSVLVQPGREVGVMETPGVWELRNPGPEAESSSRARPLPEGLAADLARVGLVTSTATVGRWTGPCSVCPDGFEPMVLVIDSTDGVGLSPATAELLHAGNAVTPFDMEGIDEERVAGVPVRVGSVPSGVQAVVLSSAVSGSGELADRQPALIGSTAGLDEGQVRQILRVAEGEGASVAFDDPQMDMLRSATASGSYATLRDRGPWFLWPSVIVLLVVALAATAAHRREHGEAARVLKVLGARPRSARRLASLTAGTLTGTGAVLGLTAALMVATVMTMGRSAGDPSPWNRDTALVLVVSLILPVVVALLARLIPPYRSLDDPDGPMPA